MWEMITYAMANLGAASQAGVLASVLELAGGKAEECVGGKVSGRGGGGGISRVMQVPGRLAGRQATQGRQLVSSLRAFWHLAHQI